MHLKKIRRQRGEAPLPLLGVQSLCEEITQVDKDMRSSVSIRCFNVCRTV